MDMRENIVYRRTLPERKGRFSEYPEGMGQELQEFLKKRGIGRLYCHQAEMFERAVQGENLVITTSTASGKTLGFLLPVVEEILKNPLSRAVFIYPTKALASDQYRAILPFVEYFGEDRLCAGVYDGDTPVGERSRLRKNANIILTNPEMINSAFLPNHSKSGFDFIFSNLKYIIIDELHTYRGAFGSHLANVFRRLSRVCRYYGASPAFLCSSATIANPVELAEKICGRSFGRVERDGSPAPLKNYYLLQPPKIKAKNGDVVGQMSASAAAASLIPELLEEGRSFLTFARSRRNVEVILKEARDKLEGQGFLGSKSQDLISGYRGGYTPVERKKIEERMTAGELKGLISTNALELGIDIGRIDITVLAGYPGTRASFWQQTGRAGRDGRVCDNYMIMDNLPFDQYIRVNPQWLFDGASESAVVDADNLLIQLAHIRAAAAELPLGLDDMALFPELGETIPVLLNAGELENRGGKFAWSGDSFPAGDYSLRNIDKVRYKLMNQESGRVITEMDEMQAFREIHTGAVYLHGGDQYQVVRMDRETRTSYALPFKGNYYTIPGGETRIQVIHKFRESTYGRCLVCFGDVNVDDTVYMYKKLQFHNHQNLGYEPLERPLSKDFDTESLWIGIPSNVVRVYRGLLQETAEGRFVRNNHFEGLCFAIENAARMAAMAEQEDMGTTMSSNALHAAGDGEEQVCLYLYDKYVGGLGYAEKAFDLLPEIVEHAISMVGGCGCEDGCAACVGDYRLDKKMVLWGLENLKKELENPKGMKNVKYQEEDIPLFVMKRFPLEELPERFEEFCRVLDERGEELAGFFRTLRGISWENGQLTMAVRDSFSREWVLEKENAGKLKRLFYHYTDAGEDFAPRITVEGGKMESREIRSKLERRYESLRGEDNGRE